MDNIKTTLRGGSVARLVKLGYLSTWLGTWILVYLGLGNSSFLGNLTDWVDIWLILQKLQFLWLEKNDHFARMKYVVQTLYPVQLSVMTLVRLCSEWSDLSHHYLPLFTLSSLAVQKNTAHNIREEVMMVASLTYCLDTFASRDYLDKNSEPAHLGWIGSEWIHEYICSTIFSLFAFGR